MEEGYFAKQNKDSNVLYMGAWKYRHYFVVAVIVVHKP